MDYIIENANILKENQLSKNSILIKENKFSAYQAAFHQYKLIRMDAEPYIMTPTTVLLDTKIPFKGTFTEMKKYMIDQFILRGCTTLFTYVKVSYENELIEKINELKTSLLNSPIDFIIGVKIPIRILTPSFIRKCKKEKVPAIFLELHNNEELEHIPWGWIREAMFPYNCPLIPLISSSFKKETKHTLAKWKVTVQNERISALYENLEENQPLTVPVLNKIGLYPQKGSLMCGMEVSYNLYLKGREIRNADDEDLFHNYFNRLVVTVHNGKVVRAGKEVLFRPGNGKHVKIRTPSYFTL